MSKPLNLTEIIRLRELIDAMHTTDPDTADLVSLVERALDSLTTSAPLTAPMDRETLAREADVTGRVAATIAVDLDDLLDGDIDHLNTVISTRLTGEDNLTDISFSAVSGKVLLDVSGVLNDTFLDPQ